MRKIALTLALLLPCPALACSLCGTMSRRVSLVQEFEQANVAVYGHLKNAKLLDAKNGTGTTEFHFDAVIKDADGFPKQKMIVLPRFLPALDAKDPPRYVMFFRVPSKTLEPYNGRQIASPDVLHFVAKLTSYRDNPVEALRVAAKHLDDADPQIAEEAFLAFAKADDKLVNQVAKSVSPEMLRKLMKTPDLEPERLSMYAYLLGACGDKNDVEQLRKLLKDPSPRMFRAYEGILAGYIMMQPKEGWAFTHETLRDAKSEFVLRYAVLRTLRFFYNANPEEHAANVLLGEGLAIAQPDVADVAIQDLMRWKRWDHTKLIVSCYDRASHQSPLVKNSLVRYALACPQSEAKTLVERVRRDDPKLLQYLQEELK
jgi:hypothetical protein